MIGKPRGLNGARPIYVHLKEGREYTTPRGKHFVGPCKVYVGSAAGLRAAQQIEREKYLELNGELVAVGDNELTCGAYADEWLDLHHGVGTKRSATATYKDNRGKLRAFRDKFADRTLDGGVSRREALAWAKQHPANARVVSAMFNDAINDEVAAGNPFGNRRLEHGRERKHIHPLTEEEVNRLADIALRHWGMDGYGRVAMAFVLFGAWVGCRPGETFAVALDDLDFEKGEARIRRVKKRGGRHPVDIVVFPRVAQDAVRAMGEVSSAGPIFRTVQGKAFSKGNLTYYWTPIVAAFRQTVTDERWAELLDGADDRKHLDFYSLRHYCASQIVANGGNEYDVSAQLGNSPEVARDTYVHSYTEQRNERNRQFLEGGAVVELKTRRGA